MATPITAKTITKQFGGNYLIGIIMLALAAAILVFCGIFCGTQLGWTNLLTIILLIALAACIVFIVVLLIKTALAKNHPSLKRHGGAAQLAARINEGMNHPRYLAHVLGGNDEPATLITDDFIVSFSNFPGLTDISDIRKIQATYIPKTVMVGVTPVGAVAAYAINTAGQRYADNYWEKRGVNENTKFDYLMITDSAGKTREFGIHHQDLEQVLNLLLSLNPQIQLDPNPYRL